MFLLEKLSPQSSLGYMEVNQLINQYILKKKQSSDFFLAKYTFPGGYMTGTSTLEVYDADILVAETGMIVCSMQVVIH